MHSGILIIENNHFKLGDNDLAELALSFGASESKTFEITKAKDFDLKKLNLIVYSFSVFGEEAKGLGAIKYQDDYIEISEEIMDSGLNQHIAGIKLYESTNNGAKKEVFSALHDDFYDEEYLTTGIRSWLGLDPNDEWPETEDS